MAAKNEELKRLLSKIRGRSPLFVAQSRQFALQWLLQNTVILEELNRKQLREGKDVHGETIQDGYSEIWGRQRVIKGRQVRYVDLNFSGDFYKSITADPTLNFVEFNSPDEKLSRLRQLFKTQFLGLTQENATQVGFFAAQGIRDDLMKYLTE